MPKSETLQRVMAVGLSVTTVAWLAGLALLAPLFAANAQTIVDGDLIRASNSFDVYIVKKVGSKQFKRLILNPDIFNSYGHLDWNNVKVVDPSVVNNYTSSQLVRNITGEKVYQLSETGEDTGSKRHLNMTASEFVAEGYDWDAVYQINQFEEDLYVSGSDIMPGDVVAGDVSASLAPDSQASATVPKTADNIEFGTWRVTGTGTINQVVFERNGVGNTTDFSNVYLYEGGNRLTSGRTVNSSTNEVIFGSLNVDINGSVDLVLRADIAGSSGNVHYFDLESMTLAGGGSVSGLPVSGNSLTLGGQDAGTITLADTGSVSNPFVGAQNVELTRFTMNASTEDALVERIRLINTGTVNTTELTNVYAQIDSQTVTTQVNGSGEDYVDLSFTGDGYMLEKGKTKTVRVYGDVGGEADETIILYVEESPDVLAIGQSFGFGMQTDISGFDSNASGESHTLTLQGGDVTIAFNGPNAQDIGDDTDDTPFLDLAVTAQNNIDVRTTQMWLCWDNDGDATFDDMSDAVLAEINDTKVVDADTGLTLNGPVDGSSWTHATTNTVCGGDSTDPGNYTFTEDWSVSAGETRNISFRLDVEADNDIADGDIFSAVLEGWGDQAGTNGDLTVMRYADNNNAVPSSAIVPSGDIAGRNMTVKQSSLSATRASTPVSDTYIQGEQGVDVVGITFTAGNASDMTLTDLTLGAWVSDDATTATSSFTNGDEGDGLGPDDIMPSVWLVDGDTGSTISGTEGYTDNAGTNDEVQFTSLSWNIPAGESRTLLVRGNVSTNAPSGSDNDGIFFDIDATGDVSATDQDGNTRNLGSADPLDGDVIATIAANGSLAENVGNDTPSSAIVVMGNGKGSGAFDDVGEGYHVSDFQFDATDESFDINKITLENTGSGGDDAVLEMALDYQDEQGNWRRAKGQPDGNNERTLNLSTPWFIPKDDGRVGKVYVSVGERTDGADSTDQISVKISVDSSADDQFEATGVSSGSKLDDDDINEVTGVNAHHVFNTKPTFTKVAGIGDSGHAPSNLIAGSGQKVATFKIAADAHHDVLFTSASGSLEFDVTASGDGSNVQLTLFKSDGTTLSSFTGNFDSLSTFAFNFEESNLTVPAGSSVQLNIEADLSSYNEDGDNFSLRLNRDEADNVQWLDEDNASFDAVRKGPANVIDGLPMNFGSAQNN